MNLWCDEQILVHIEGPDGGRDVVVSQPMARIGAHPDSQIVLNGPGIAKRALYLHATPNGIYALNLDLEDTPLDQRGRWITDNRPLLVGCYRLTVRAASGTLASPTLPDLVSSKSAPLPIPVIGIYCGKLLKDNRRFRSPFTLLGRRPQCSLQLRGPKVSSFHCALYWQDRRLWCIDLLSSNGTTICGQPLDIAEVNLNDRLEVGEFGLVYYRWSPRRSMLPDWLPPSIEESARAAPDMSTASDDAPALFHTAPAAPPLGPGKNEKQPLPDKLMAELAKREAQHLLERQHWEAALEHLQRRMAQMQAELARVAGQRDELQATQSQWNADRQRLGEQHEALESAHRNWLKLQEEMVQQRDALEAARRVWQQERDNLKSERDALITACHFWEQQRAALTAKLAEHNQIVPPKTELGPAVQVPLTDQISAAEETCPTPADRDNERPPAVILAEPTPVSDQPSKPSYLSQHYAAFSSPTGDFSASHTRVEDENVVLSDPRTEKVDVAVEEKESTTDDGLRGTAMEVLRPTARRHSALHGSTQDRDDLRTLVSDRMIDMKGAQHPRAALLWGAVGIIALSLVALALSVWIWLS